MRKIFYLQTCIARRIFALALVVLASFSGAVAQKKSQAAPVLGFIENKGQITDQDYKPNPGVKYLLNMPMLNVQLKANSFSYDAYVLDIKQKPADEFGEQGEDVTHRFHRIDIEFIGANPNPAMVADDVLPSYLNYFTAGTPEEGVVQVHHYGKITYKNLYPGIDLEFLARPGTKKPVEYNFIIHPGADASLIRWKYNGSKNTKLVNGAIRISTTHGILEETAPVTYEKETGSAVQMNYKDEAGIFSFTLKPYNTKNTLIIDPIPDLRWGTYIGSAGIDNTFSIDFDATGNLFVTGSTTSTTTIATAGTFQTTFQGTAGYGSGGDAFVMKMSPTGTLIWGTYCGSTNNEIGYGIKLDNSGNIYCYGTTSSTTGMGTTGTFQPAWGGGSYNDPFLAKFDGTGARIWSTYYGGTGNDRAVQNGIQLDAAGNIFITGTNNTPNNMAITTVGAYQRTNGSTSAYDEPFVAKFTPAGQLTWGTYYGGVLHDIAGAIAIDASGNAYITGQATSTALIATVGAYQTTYGGGTYDAYIAKISATGGQLLWGTYYGGALADVGTAVNLDPQGNIIVSGYTASTSGIATPGAYQTTYGGGAYDGFVVKFNASGTRLWGTYYGGSGDDIPRTGRVDGTGNIYICGDATSTTGIATSGAYQTTFAGGIRDIFMTKFTGTGSVLWGTYYGGALEDLPWTMEKDGNGNLWVLGRTVSTTGIASAGAPQTVYGGGTYDGFIAKFQEQAGNNNAGINKMTNPSGYLCAGNHDVKVEITNAGFNTMNSVTVNWDINGVPQTPVSVTTPMLSGNSREITLGNVNFPVNSLKTIRVWTSMPNGTTDTVTTNDTIVVSRKAGLNGTYTIGGTTPDYATFAAAVADLNNYGVCGPVVFQVRPGAYAGRIVLNQITGASPVNTITFSGSGILSTVLTAAGTSANDFGTIMLNGTDHTTFRDMAVLNTGTAFAAGVWLTNTADSNRFMNMAVLVDSLTTNTNVNGIVVSGTSTSVADGNSGNNNLFDSIYFRGGYYGIRINGMNTTTNFVLRNKVNNCNFFKQYSAAMYLRSQSGLVVKNNVVDSVRNTTSYGLYLDYCSNVEIANNRIIARDQGIVFNYVNKVLYNPAFVSRVYNNMVSSTSNYAAYLTQSSQLKIWHNSFSAEAAHSVLRFVTNTTMELKNNHIFNRSTLVNTYVIHADNATNFMMLDYNNYFTTSAFVYIGTVHYANIPVFQASFPTYNLNSYNQNPIFNSLTDLHTSINLSGIYVGIDEDIDKDFRNTISPVVGADEANIPNNAGISRLISPAPVFCAGSQDVKVQIGNYGINAVDSVRVFWSVNGVMQTPTYVNTSIGIRGFLDITLGNISFNLGESKKLKVWTSMPNGVNDSLRNNDTLITDVRTGLSGTYTIGGVNPDFADFNAAAYALNVLGVCSAVEFQVRPGTYSEQLMLSEIRGASVANTITFRGAGKSNTNLSFSGTSNANWITLLLNGADHVTFRDMTISAMGANFGIAVLMTNSADSNKLVNVVIQTSATSTSLTLVGAAVISSTTDLYAPSAQPGDGNLFDSVEVNGGYYGIYLTGNSSYQTVSNSVFTDQNVSGIFCSSQDYLKVMRNKLNPMRTTGFSYSINVSSCSNFEVYANTVNTGGDYGLYIQASNMIGQNPAFRSRIYNNMVCNTSGYAFYCENTENVQVLHNSFRSVGTGSLIAAAAYFNGSQGIQMQNNHIRNDNPNSFALYGDLSTFDSLDYNNYYSFGSFVRISTIYPNLTALKSSLTQFNQNSLSQDPKFVALTNLHTNIFLQGNYANIDRDIDGEARCPQNVSIGADDENQGFMKPVISTNHNTFFTNYPVRFSHNIIGQSGTVFKWSVDGTYISDSMSFMDKFSNPGSYKVKLFAQRCIYSDSTELTLNIASGRNIIQLSGNSVDSNRVFTSYADAGATAINFLGENISAGMTSGYNVDTAVLGTYYFWYVVTDAWGNKDSVNRKVVIIDDVAPVISIVGNDTVTMEVFGAINDQGVTVADNYYTTMTTVSDSSQVNKAVVGIYPLTYTSTDPSGNVSKKIRWVKVVDTGLPVIKLNGPDTIMVDVYSLYIEMGAKVTDNYCSKSVLTWDVDIYPSTSMLGEYLLTYTATDCQGNVAIPVTRLVKIVDREKPEIELIGFSYIEHMRWAPFTDQGVSITDNYYPESALQLLVDTTQNLNTLLIGIYNVCYQVTDPSGNKSSKVCRTVSVVENTTSVGTQAGESGITIYPNPNNGKFTLKMDASFTEPAQVVVYDVAGKEVYRSIADQQQNDVNTGYLAPGSYLVKVVQGTKVTTLRMNIIR